ncbi:Pc22g13960 [Penicillium rubens Wisconsin 54-1255]|uniref:Pc22g13960 protein n=1 Tax=Penicillium rubens (strain ATCC 28089 / DSM 1075 / NRRL 1951 / Wisconsin 54-1255) TaxID=500485 RepID=B6HU26_PENRW|nr:Pc22g13960 [Penicillium rubens Wisconsin 54-1255]
MNLLYIRDAIFRRDNDGILLSSGGQEGLIISVVFTALATCFVAMRMYTRMKLMNRVEANDWMVIIALVNSYVFMALDIIEALSTTSNNRSGQAFWLTIPFYNAAVLCAKASILMQYFRVFPTHRMRVVCWVMITVLAIYGTWAVISAFLNCIPVAKFWDDSIQGYCLNKTKLWFSNASMHIATDIAILVIPIPALMAVDLPRKQKIALMIIYQIEPSRTNIAQSVCVTSVIRLVSLKKIAESSDPTYDNVGAASWSAIECNTGIICACLPTLKPLVARIFPGMVSTFNASRPTRGDTTQRNSDWNGDASTLGAHGEEHEYGAGDPERVLALVPGTGFRSSIKRWTREEEKKLARIAFVPEPRDRPNLTYPRPLPAGSAVPF